MELQNEWTFPRASDWSPGFRSDKPASMKQKLTECSACGKEIAKSARTCPHCGKTFTSSVGLITAVIIGLVVGWLLIARTCSQAAEVERHIEDANRKIQKSR
jgi:F0F1-type ATP synthase assembly protein I